MRPVKPAGNGRENADKAKKRREEQRSGQEAVNLREETGFNKQAGASVGHVVDHSAGHSAGSSNVLLLMPVMPYHLDLEF